MAVIEIDAVVVNAVAARAAVVQIRFDAFNIDPSSMAG